MKLAAPVSIVFQRETEQSTRALYKKPPDLGPRGALPFMFSSRSGVYRNGIFLWVCSAPGRDLDPVRRLFIVCVREFPQLKHKSNFRTHVYCLTLHDITWHCVRDMYTDIHVSADTCQTGADPGFCIGGAEAQKVGVLRGRPLMIWWWGRRKSRKKFFEGARPGKNKFQTALPREKINPFLIFPPPPGPQDH